MSTATFPALAGLGWSMGRKPMWRTLVQEAVSGKDAAAGLMMYPLWEWTLSHELLRADSVNLEFQTLVGFVNQCHGMLVPFYYTDRHDYIVTNQSFGTGDGSTVAFQLVRTFGGFTEPVKSVNAITNIKINGSVTTAYTLGSTGIVTFTTAPANAAALTWTGTYYWLCRFLQDDPDFEEFMQNFLTQKEIKFRTVKQ